MLTKDSSGSYITKAMNDDAKAKTNGLNMISRLVSPVFVEERENVRKALDTCNIMEIHLENVKQQFNASFNVLATMLGKTKFTNNNDDFIENIIDLFRGIMNEQDALPLGTVLKNLPPNEFDEIKKQYNMVHQDIVDQFTHELANHLYSRKGGRKTYKNTKKVKKR